MKYFRTKDGRIVENRCGNKTDWLCGSPGTIQKYYSTNAGAIWEKDIINQADAIEELCDERVLSHYFKETKYTKYKVLPKDQWGIMAKSVSLRLKEKITDINYLGAIWTDKGLIYVAKINDKGELELL